MSLVLGNYAIWVCWLLYIKQIFLEYFQELFDKSAMNFSRLDVFDSNRVEQDLYEALKLSTRKEYSLVVSEVAGA